MFQQGFACCLADTFLNICPFELSVHSYTFKHVCIVEFPCKLNLIIQTTLFHNMISSILCPSVKIKVLYSGSSSCTLHSGHVILIGTIYLCVYMSKGSDHIVTLKSCKLTPFPFPFGITLFMRYIICLFEVEFSGK